MPPPVVILCGGRGTRLQEHTHAIPKALIEIGGRPILWHVMQLYASQGFGDFVLCTGYLGEQVSAFARAQAPAGVRVRCVDTDLETPTGGRIALATDSPERDFLYVEDAVAAYLALAIALDGHGARGEAFNAGSGRSWAVREVVDAVCRAAGADVRPDIRGAGTPTGEIDRQWIDASRLHAVTGWEPSVGLDEGLARTVGWYRRHLAALQ